MDSSPAPDRAEGNAADPIPDRPSTMFHPSPFEPDPVASLDRRRNDRREAGGKLRISLLTPDFSGRIDNFSEAGVFFFSDQRLRVMVEVDESGVKRSYSGTLVRLVAMSPEESGFAIEFDQRS